jgi:hypothetical protein
LTYRIASACALATSTTIIGGYGCLGLTLVTPAGPETRK